MRKPTSIDIFAGCGGLSRGFEWAGYDCIAFNELNKDAADTFAANFPEALRLDGGIETALSTSVLDEVILPLIKQHKGLDILSGGPPCQGYSGIGHRRTHPMSKRDIPTNHLYTEMIRVIRKTQPKVFVFENVEGILTAAWYDFSEEKNLLKKWNDGENYTISQLKSFTKSLGISIKAKRKKEMLLEARAKLKDLAKGHLEEHRGEIFRDVWTSFSNIEGYVAQPTLLHAYGFGVPQNRPRVMIMGIREDILENSNIQPAIFNPEDSSRSYASQLRNNGGFFPTWDEGNVNAPDLIDVISDLDFTGWAENEPFYQKPADSDYQKSLRAGVQTDDNGREILTDHLFSNHKPKTVKRFKYMLKHNITKQSDLPKEMRTNKFNQKPLPPRWETKPTMTVTSMPDDYIHYAKPRSFSVREWARMQSFPDKHVFCGKRTTGGPRRAGNPSEGLWDREVPKYTQIGNAVPPLMAKAIGDTVSSILGLKTATEVSVSKEHC
jgi:DNA (cytosine-5)-methyltransferase 1